MHPADDVQKSHVDHSVAPAAQCFRGRFTWLSSQWKLGTQSAQFSLKNNNLSSTTRYAQVSSGLIGRTPSPLDRLRLEVVPPA
jgi:hypothetical protein